MKRFFKDVNKRNRKEMIDFLKNHFRYYTMNSWNLSTSYANNVKIYNLDLPKEIENKIYELIQTESFYDEINSLISAFDSKYDYKWQVGFNGRSNGYLVLYKGGYDLKPYFSKKFNSNGICYSDYFGRWFSKEEIDKHPLKDKFYKSIYSYPGQSVDENEDFEDWSIEDLRDRVKLVQSFDKLCDNILDAVIKMCQEYEIKEKTIYKSVKIKTLEKINR